jgi:hypothetical protein
MTCFQSTLVSARRPVGHDTVMPETDISPVCTFRGSTVPMKEARDGMGGSSRALQAGGYTGIEAGTATLHRISSRWCAAVGLLLGPPSSKATVLGQNITGPFKRLMTSACCGACWRLARLAAVARLSARSPQGAGVAAGSDGAWGS